ncbi:M61 family metallopeptidase [Thiohalocapsa marina]|uniref:M61 family metallopeptidase n=1 Tax=Thiohalocapsa marina TaxID=424902 RepID=A0A5M8FT45_9GAMM|nr:PDZ domain-containing protein [Thiohalocapsa marina]KAA6186975.1 M61 family metallopeptidase [Thiohalocapsa marina]
MSEPSPLIYRVTPARPEAHVFAVELEIPAPPDSLLILSMPAWIPGSYMIRDFARNVLGLRAWPAAGAGGGMPDEPTALPVSKLDKQTWQVQGVAGPVCVRYEVYAWDLSVRSAHLDATHAYFNGPSLFLRVGGLDHQPCRVELAPPPGEAYADWRVATSLSRAGAEPWGFGGYRADDYDDLIDHPVEMGRFALVPFAVRGVPHWMAISGRQHADLDRLAADLAPICEQQAALFGELPVDRYLFLTMAVGEGYGGLEHRFSCSLLCSRNDLPRLPAQSSSASDQSAESGPLAGSGASPTAPAKEYRRFLGLCSHEYFHLWNVKRIRPAVLAENGLQQEVHTRLLWAFEGITSYYDDLMLVRSGRIDASGYLEQLAETITRVMRTPGRLRQTLAESSFDAWTRFYKQDENAPNAIVSYYAKGALVALALDLTIRTRSGDTRSLDDVMRALWRRHGRTGIGVAERGIEALAAEVTGLDLDAFFAQALDSTADLDLAALLAEVGVDMRLRPSKGPKDMGSVCDGAFGPVPADADIGIRLQADGAEARIAVVLDDRPGQRAGLSAGDVLVAIDGLRATAAGADDLLRRARIGEPLEIHAFRRDELMHVRVLPEQAPADTCELRLLADAPEAHRSRRAAWLGAA